MTMEKEYMKTALAKLRGRQKTIRSMLLTEIVMMVFLLVLLFTVGIKAVYIVGAVVLVYNLFFIRPAKKQYLRELSHVEAVCGTGGSLMGCDYLAKDALPKDILQQYSLVSPRQWPVDAICRHRLTGSYAGAELSICECSFALKYGAKNGELDFVSGSFIEAQLPKSTALKLCCMSRDIAHISEALPELECYGLKPAAFKNRRAQELAFGFADDGNVPEWLESRLVKLCSNGAKILLSIQGDRLAIFIIGRFYAQKNRLSDNLSAESLSANRLPERDAALDLIRIIQQKS